jgi:AraC-like DNA-binding protein
MFISYRTNAILPTKHHSVVGLYPVWTGCLKALPNYECKPRMLDDYFILYVASGKGIFRTKGIEHKLEANDVFFLFPGVVHYYATDPKDLLELFWIGFNGPNAQVLLKNIGIEPKKAIIKAVGSRDILDGIKNIINDSAESFPGSDLILSGRLYQLFGLLASLSHCEEAFPEERHSNTSKPIEKALTFIEANYLHDITISQIASYAGLSRTHFATRFKQETGCSPSDQLAKIRLKQARFYLACSDISIVEIAHSVGFQDPQYFSRFFTKHEGKSASAYRNEYKSKNPSETDASKTSF